MFCKDALDSQKMSRCQILCMIYRSLLWTSLTCCLCLIHSTEPVFTPLILHPLERHRPTIISSTLDQLILSSQNRKRHYHLKLQHN
ncbi:hypothetical protein F4703DRAFT_1947407 [Phycomyces blakesleeanus]